MPLWRRGESAGRVLETELADAIADLVAVKTEQGVQQSRENAEQLARLAEELTAKLSRFKLVS